MIEHVIVCAKRFSKKLITVYPFRFELALTCVKSYIFLANRVPGRSRPWPMASQFTLTYIKNPSKLIVLKTNVFLGSGQRREQSEERSIANGGWFFCQRHVDTVL
jgi:hypothetical protein